MLIELATVIRSRRLKLGLSERQLSSKLNIEIAMLTALEQGLVDPDMELLHDTARELLWSLEVLMLKVESLARKGEDTKRNMKLSARTRIQLASLEHQQMKLGKQVDGLKRQAQALQDSRLLIQSAGGRATIAPISNKVDAQYDFQLKTHRDNLERIEKIKQACDDHERFSQRIKSRRLSVIR